MSLTLAYQFGLSLLICPGNYIIITCIANGCNQSPLFVAYFAPSSMTVIW